MIAERLLARIVGHNVCPRGKKHPIHTAILKRTRVIVNRGRWYMVSIYVADEMSQCFGALVGTGLFTKDPVFQVVTESVAKRIIAGEEASP